MDTEIKQSTQSQEKNLQSIKRLFESQELTIQMAILYLHQHKNQQPILNIMLQALNRFPIREIFYWAPSLVFIAVHSKQNCFHKFLNDLATKSIPLYLSIRWSYATYCDDRQSLEKYRNKLDMALINHLSSPQQALEMLSGEQIGLLIKKKEIMSNYINILNHFFEKLFRLPIKLKKAPELARKQELIDHLKKLFDKFSSYQEETYCTGICFPLFSQIQNKTNSYVGVRILKQECIPFSTKDKIPFKLVFETLSFEDYDKVNSEVEQIKNIDEKFLPPTNSLILPQTYFGKEWNQMAKKLRMESPYGHLQSYLIHAYIVKLGDDVRQEYMAMQLMKVVEKMIEKEHLKLWVRTYRIIPFNKDCGLIQFVEGTKTISTLKSLSNEKSLRTIYKQIYGDNWQTAITNFTKSLAGYSLYQYLFQVKDRHNNNILIDAFGHLVHIDFSFMISSSPGNLNFEKSPFKLTTDYIQLMEGMESDIFKHFKFLLFTGLKFVRKYKKEIMSIVLMMKQCSQIKCFANFDQEKMQKRFHEHCTDEELQAVVDGLVAQAYQSYTTGHYDRYQYYTNYIHW